MAKTIGLTFPKTEPEEVLFTCPVCGKEYKTEEGLNKHIAEKHPDGAGE